MSIRLNSDLIIAAAVKLMEEEDAVAVRDAKWKAFADRTEAIEAKYVPVLATMFGKQEKAVLSAMAGKPVPDTSGKMWSEEKAVSDAGMAAAEAYLGDKFNPDDWQERFERMELPVVTEAF